MRGAKLQGGLPNELRPPNLYYDHKNARQTFHPPTELQTANGYILIQNRQEDPHNLDNRRQTHLTDPSPYNYQDIKFMDSVVESHHEDVLSFQMGVGKEQC